MASRRSTLLFYAAAAITVVLDQVTKAIARAALPVDRSVTIIPGFLDLRLAYNSGAAFGILSDWAPLFIIMALVAIFVIVRLKRTGPDARSLSLGLGLLMGGAIGNLIDRLVSPDHMVTDFINIHISSGGKNWAWPTFNLADIGIVLGALLTLFYVYVIDKRREETRQRE